MIYHRHRTAFLPAWSATDMPLFTKAPCCLSRQGIFTDSKFSSLLFFSFPEANKVSRRPSNTGSQLLAPAFTTAAIFVPRRKKQLNFPADLAECHTALRIQFVIIFAQNFLKANFPPGHRAERGKETMVGFRCPNPCLVEGFTTRHLTEHRPAKRAFHHESAPATAPANGPLHSRCPQEYPCADRIVVAKEIGRESLATN